MQQYSGRVNPSEEIIKIGPLQIRFLVTGDDTNGNVSVFEVVVPVGQKLAAPAHKNDAFEEIVYGIAGVLTACPSRWARGKPCASHVELYTALIISVAKR
jgi:quercetin dioxygenase-like cupin family protein